MANLPLTIKETQEGLLDKKFSAVELVEGYLGRINKYNPEYNIYLTVSEEKAYADAKKIDAGNKKLPLFGVTTAVKDLFVTKGIRTTASSKVLENYVPAYSATAVERLEKAGAILIGKTNCDAWAHGASGENSDYGPTKNPWNKSFVPGGSSSGSAAAVAANMCLISIGSDTGGSVRQPANFCGDYGFKPTYGAISRYGLLAMSSSLDTVGSFARCTDDIETIFNILKGSDGHDATVKDARYEVPSAKLRIGIPKEYFEKGMDKEVEEGVQTAIKTYRNAGIEFKEVSIPMTKNAISVYYIIQPADVSSNLGRYDGVRYGKDRSVFGDEAKRRIMLGTYVLSAGYYDAYYLKAMKVRSRLISDYDKVFEEVDALIAPVSPTPPFKLGEKANDPLKMYLSDIFTVSANLVGIPGLAIPSGFTKDGLPLGFQLMGSRFSENTLFSLGKLYERETDYQPKIAPLT